MCEKNSLEQVRRFYTLYGPSNHGALLRWRPIWAKTVDHAIRNLGNANALGKVIQSLASGIDNHPGISPHILLLRPGKQRHECHVEVITDHVSNLLVDWVISKPASQVVTLHAELERGPLGTRSFARRIFEAKYGHAPHADE